MAGRIRDVVDGHFEFCDSGAMSKSVEMLK